ncbi:MAG: 50S ribosomal protein L11 methyltransferase [Jatrophihabitantaceae bacterium]
MEPATYEDVAPHAPDGGPEGAGPPPSARESRYAPSEAALAADKDLLVASLRGHLVDLRETLDSATALMSWLGEPPTPAAMAAINRFASRHVPRWHFPMLNDEGRNHAFATALRQQVRPGDHVLDIGSGSGLLAMLAIQAGAARVTSCEADPLLAAVARQVIQSNGFSDVITVIAARSTDLEVGHGLDEPVDLIVTEIVDCGLIGEGLLPTLEHARQRLLKPGGRLIPHAARVAGAVLSCPSARHLNSVQATQGLDLEAMNSLSTPGHFPLRLDTWPHTLLSDQIEIFDIDLVDEPLADGSRVLRLPITESAAADGLVAWFELDLAEGLTLDNAPGNAGSHWMQAYLPFAMPCPVIAGEHLVVEVSWGDLQLSATPLARQSMEGSR